MAAQTLHVREAFRQQAVWCEQLGSPFTAALLTALAARLEAPGPLAELLAGWQGDPVAQALPLRLAGALHALVLERPDSALARRYPPLSMLGDDPALMAEIETAIAGRPGHFADTLARPPQTNEVRRSCALLGGFLEVARLTGQPLRLLEIGSSAGLNLVWDRYGYRLGDWGWGEGRAPLLTADWRGPPPALDASVEIVARAGCDRTPIDLTDPAEERRLAAYVWADQRDRLDRLGAAAAVVRGIGLRVEKADAGEWVERQLAVRQPGAVTVVFHSIVWQYLGEEARRRVTEAIEAAGLAAEPLAWLRLEPNRDGTRFELRLSLWPGGEDRALGHAHPHGAWVEWFG
jgi:hypothetical protein